MSRLLSLAGSPPLQALEARSYPAFEARASSAYSGCVSLDTSTASYTYNLDPSDPPTCAASCGDEYQYVALQAQFCFCFPSLPAIYATFNDSDCSINCDYPYQDESCGGVTSGTLIDVYSFYAGSDISLPGAPSGTSNGGSGISSPTASVQVSSLSEDPYTPIGPTTSDQPSPATPAPTYSATNEASSPTGIAGQGGSTITSTLWTTVTSFTTIYPGGPLQTTVLSLPVGTTYITPGVLTSSPGTVKETITCHDVSVATNNPYVSEMSELEVYGSSTITVLAAVVPVETAAAGKVRRSVGLGPSLGIPAGNESSQATSGYGQGTTAVPALSGPSTGTGWVLTASRSQVVNATVAPSQFPVTARATRAGFSWRHSLVVFAVVLGALWL